MARLLGTKTAGVQSNRLEAVREAASRFGCVCLLKGAATLIASPDGRVAINSSGSPALASGGTGDVLTGVIAALLAQGLPPFEAAVAGAFVHGHAGEIAAGRVGMVGTLAGDVRDALPEALRTVSERSALGVRR
jgi:NAD(P)H-hydrate epimerase